MEFLKKYKAYLVVILAIGLAFLLRNKFTGSNDEPLPSSTSTTPLAVDQSSSGEEGVLSVAEIPPLFPGCNYLSTIEEKKKCSDEKLLQYLYAQIKYPDYALQHGIEGRCVVTFVVEPDGKIGHAKIIKDIGGGCGEASLLVVQSMNKMSEAWTAGMDKGKPARVRFNLPVSFKLNDQGDKSN